MTNIKIVSNGTSFGTKVYADNIEITGITSMKISELTVGGVLEVTLSFIGAELDITYPYCIPEG